MNCPYCQQEMKDLFPNEGYERTSIVWQCKNCPQEVRAEEYFEHFNYSNGGIIRRLSMYVKHNNKEYCLHWNYDYNSFEIFTVGMVDMHGVGGMHSRIFFIQGDKLPDITPTNALPRLLTFLVFS